MNPTAINFWVTGTAIGYLVGGPSGAVWGLAITSGISMILNFVYSFFSK